MSRRIDASAFVGLGLMLAVACSFIAALATHKPFYLAITLIGFILLSAD